MRTISLTTIAISLLLFIASCGASSTTSTSSTSSSNPDEYIALPKDAYLSAYNGKKVWFEGTISNEIHQHMMKGSLEPESHVYIDYNDSQTVGYYRDIKLPANKKTLKFYGLVGQMSGAGKGGGTHTETYIDLDKVE